VLQAVVRHSILDIAAVGVYEKRWPKLAPTIEIDAPPLSGPFGRMTSDKTGASKDNTGSTMVPTTVEMVTLAFQPTSIPTGVPHRRLEIDCQLVITHPVPPIRIEGVRSAVPKFRPWNVAVALPECGEF
jgi:hypothetical protein